MDYSKLFLWNPNYFLSNKEVYSHKPDADFNDPNERISLNVYPNINSSAETTSMTLKVSISNILS